MKEMFSFMPTMTYISFKEMMSSASLLQFWQNCYSSGLAHKPIGSLHYVGQPPGSMFLEALPPKFRLAQLYIFFILFIYFFLMAI